MLEKAGHQHALVAAEGFLGAIPVMHIEVHDRHPLQPMRIERMTRGDRDIVEQAEAHRAVRSRVMAGRANRAERIVELAGHHRIDGSHGGTGRTQRRLPAVLVQQGIGIDGVIATGTGQGIAHGRQRAALMHALDLLGAGQRRIAARQQRRQAAGDQLILDRLQPRRRLGMPVAHFMLAAIGMGKDRGAHSNYYA